MAVRGKLYVHPTSQGGSLSLRGPSGKKIVWIAPVGVSGTSVNRGSVAVRVEAGSDTNGRTRGRLWVSDVNGFATGRLELRGPGGSDGEGSVLVRLGQKAYLPNGSGREGSVAVFKNNSLRGEMYTVAGGFGVLDLYDDKGQEVTIKLDGGDGTVYAKRIVAETVTAKSLIATRAGEGDGLIEGTIKNFAVPHPSRPGYTLRYSALEGPEAGIFVRGTLRLRRGRGSVRLPRHFALLASRKGLTCNLTARSAKSRGVVASVVSPSRLLVQEIAGGHGSYAVDYAVFGLRKDHADFRVVSKTTGGGSSRHQAPAQSNGSR